MILKGNRRGGAKDLATHLMKPENDHVEVHELRGFVSGTLMGALNETYAMSKGTRSQKFLYSMSVNPPPGEKTSTADILDAIEKSEKILKLTGQPRAIVFHEKDGRRHAHVVWSLINAKEMKAVRLRNDRTKLQPLTLQLYVQHGWKVPDGLLDRTNRDPRSYCLKEYHQARRHGRDAKVIKAAIQTAWAISDSKAAFEAALGEHGMMLAKGDRAGLVCVDTVGEVHSLPKVLGVRIKVVREKVGSERDHPERFKSVDKAKAGIAAQMGSTLNRLKEEAEAKERRKKDEFEQRKSDLIRRQRLEREALKTEQEQRLTKEAQARQARFRRGLKGLWDGLRGHNRRIRKANEREALDSLRRDQAERDAQVFTHLDQRRQVNLFRLELRNEYVRDRARIDRDTRACESMRSEHSRDGPDM